MLSFVIETALHADFTTACSEPKLRQLLYEEEYTYKSIEMSNFCHYSSQTIWNEDFNGMGWEGISLGQLREDTGPLSP